MCPRLLLNISVWTFSVTGKNEGLLNSSNSILPCNIFQQNVLFRESMIRHCLRVDMFPHSRGNTGM